MIDIKQINNLPLPIVEKPLDITALANSAIGFYDCSLIFYNNFTDDGYVVGNMGSRGSFIFPFFYILENKEYNFELFYACGHPSGSTVQAELFLANDPSEITTVNLPVTAGWLSFSSVSGSITLNKGVNLIRIRRSASSQSFNVSKLRIFENN